MIRFVPAFAWVLSLTATALAMEPEGRIGDLGYDATRWEVRQRGETFDVLCRSEKCNVTITVRISAGASASCNAETAGAAPDLVGRERDPSFLTIKRPGFDIYVVKAWTGCRNARPSSVHACTVYKERTYRIDSPVFGCGGGPGFSDGALDFLEQLGAQ